MTVIGKTFEIDDLARPQFTPAQRRVLAEAERNPVTLTVDAVLGAAREATGLNDFGPEDFLERLRYWLDDTANDANRTALSRTAVYAQCVRYATTRLRLQDLLHRHPQIDEVQIERPIVIVGPFRSGTTHLVNLIATDSRLRSLPLWEGFEPVPDTHETPAARGSDPRRGRYADHLRRLHALLPMLPTMRPMSVDTVDEETELFGPDFSVAWWKSTALFRDGIDHIAGSDQTPHYEYLKTLLKALQWQRGPHRWVLKSVHHAECVRALLATFPDATIVMTHRDPVAIVQSVATLAAYLARLEYRVVNTEHIGAYWVRRIENILRALVRSRNLIPDAHRVDIPFRDFMADELGSVKHVYQIAGLDFPDEQSDRMRKFLNNHPRGKHGQISYDLPGNFGIRSSDLRRQFEFYEDYLSTNSHIR